MKYSDIQSALNKLTDQIVKQYKPNKIILFGSASQKQIDDINDVDLMIIKEEVPYYGVDRIRELYKITESDIAVDFLVYRPDEIERLILLGDPFIKEILDKGKVIYASI
jgi:predicted nucleotidyltransferase